MPPLFNTVHLTLKRPTVVPILTGTAVMLLFSLLVEVTTAHAALAESRALASVDEAAGFFSRVSAWIEGLGALSYVLAPVFMVVVAILPIPAEIPAMLNGMIFGAGPGMAITWGGALVGALVSFELARRFGRPLTERFLHPKRLARVDRVTEAAGWPGLLVLRLIPTIAFTVVNWGAGLTSLRRWTFFWTTAIGILPGAIVFTTSGAGLTALYRRYPVLAIALGILALSAIVVTVVRYRHMDRRRAHGSAASSAGQWWSPRGASQDEDSLRAQSN